MILPLMKYVPLFVIFSKMIIKDGVIIIRLCGVNDIETIYDIINDAAQAYMSR